MKNNQFNWKEYKAKGMTFKRVEKDNKVDIIKLDNGGYNVVFSLMSGNDELMRLTLFAGDSLQAQTIKENYLKDPVKLYSSIITALTV